MHGVASTASDLAERLEGASNVLVMVPSLESAEAEACATLMTLAPPEETDAIGVTFNRSPDARLDEWRAYGGPHDAANLGFVVVGDDVRSAAAAQPVTGGPPTSLAGPTIVPVSSPADLTGIGIRLSGFFADWADEDHQLVLCFHTLTTFLQYADLRTVFKFLHVLAGRVTEVGAVAHYHLDPTAHDEQTVNALLELVDAAVALDEDGTWSVRRRR